METKIVVLLVPVVLDCWLALPVIYPAAESRGE
jgi:hypothetical protein